MSSCDTLPAPETLADLRHDLRNVVGQVLGYSELLIEDATDRGETSMVVDLEKVRSAGTRLLEIVNERMGDSLILEEPSALPRETNVAARRAAENDPAASDNEPKGWLLVVDDAEENRDILIRRLERDGHTVVAARTGEEALALMSASAFDLVLLDMVMPGMSGTETLSRIKADPALHTTPVIVVSGYNEVDGAVRCIELGATDYLLKPFDPVLLRARIGASLREKLARDREAVLFEQLQTNFRRLQDLESQRDDLTHMIVHDLRTPLTSLLTGLQTVEVVGDLSEIQEEMMAVAKEGGQTLLGMINDLLDLGKMEDGSLQLEYADLQAGGLIGRALAQVSPLAKNKNIELVREVGDDLPTLRADDDKLRRTLVNLLGNALKFTPAGGKIVVSARIGEPGKTLVFAVRDTGEGIPEEAFGRIFEKFGQVESRKAGRKMSTGLGLTFCRMAVEAHGGRIWVESRMGVGSLFSFELPLGPPTPPTPRSGVQ